MYRRSGIFFALLVLVYYFFVLLVFPMIASLFKGVFKIFENLDKGQLKE